MITVYAPQFYWRVNITEWQ